MNEERRLLVSIPFMPGGMSDGENLAEAYNISRLRRGVMI